MQTLKFFQENQIKNINPFYKLLLKDMRRLNNFIDDNFLTSKCCNWKGNHINKTIFFSFKRYKHNVRRLLFQNYVRELKKNEIIKTTCHNKLCCNINHYKIIYLKNNYEYYIPKKKFIVKIQSTNKHNPLYLDFQK